MRKVAGSKDAARTMTVFSLIRLNWRGEDVEGSSISRE